MCGYIWTGYLYLNTNDGIAPNNSNKNSNNDGGDDGTQEITG